jgi:hypothetical protein
VFREFVFHPAINREAVAANAVRASADKPAADPLADFVAGLTGEQRRRLARLLVRMKEGSGSEASY